MNGSRRSSTRLRRLTRIRTPSRRKKLKRGAGHHHLTGPITSPEAEPGDILQVEILEIVPTAYGFNLNPETSSWKLGLLPMSTEGQDALVPGRSQEYEVRVQPPASRSLSARSLDDRVELPDAGMWSKRAPGRHGGNLDNKDLWPALCSTSRCG